MNTIQRRVLRAFVDSGGDMAEPEEVDKLVRYVEAVVVLLPPKARMAVEVGWGLSHEVDYDVIARELSCRERAHVTTIAARQRVSRASRLLERLIRRRSWACQLRA